MRIILFVLANFGIADELEPWMDPWMDPNDFDGTGPNGVFDGIGPSYIDTPGWNNDVADTDDVVQPPPFSTFAPTMDRMSADTVNEAYNNEPAHNSSARIITSPSSACGGPCWTMPSEGQCKPNVNSSSFEKDCLMMACSHEKISFTFQPALFRETSAYSVKLTSDPTISYSSGVLNSATFNDTALGWLSERKRINDTDYIVISLGLGDSKSYAGEDKGLKIFFSSTDGVKFVLKCLFNANGNITSATNTLTGGQELFDVKGKVDLSTSIEMKILNEDEYVGGRLYSAADLGNDTLTQSIGSQIHAAIQFKKDINFGAFAVNCTVISGAKKLMVLKEQCAAAGVNTTFDYELFSRKLEKKRSVLSYRAFSWEEYKAQSYQIRCELEFCFIGSDCENRNKTIRASATTTMNGVSCDNSAPYKYQFAKAQCTKSFLVLSSKGPYVFCSHGSTHSPRKYSGHPTYNYAGHAYANGEHYLFGGNSSPYTQISKLGTCTFNTLSVKLTVKFRSHENSIQILPGKPEIVYLCFSNTSGNEKKCEYFDGSTVKTLGPTTSTTHHYGGLGIVDGKLLAIGGLSSSSWHNTVEQFSSGKWITKSSHPINLGYITSVISLAEGVITVGGHSSGSTSGIYLYRSKSDSWKQVGALKQAIHFNTLTKISDSEYFSVYKNKAELLYWNTTDNANPTMTSTIYEVGRTNHSYYNPVIFEVDPTKCT